MSQTPSDSNHDASLPEELVAPIARIDQYMRTFVEQAVEAPELAEAILYSLLGPGKRARPLLAWHAAAACGADPTEALPAATAVELVHAFSLVHDDLPGMDDDDLRRGRPTLHKQTSVGMAILAGDAMLTLAFQGLVERISDKALGGALTGELSAGTGAMITGQVYDTFGASAKGDDPSQRLDLIHINKTGALIRAACRMGAMSAKADASQLGAITRYGDAIGLMFQVVDDLLDVTQTTEHLGKRAGKDIDAGKLTYPGVHGVELTRQRVRELHAQADHALVPFGDAAEPLRQIASYLAVRTK